MEDIDEAEQLYLLEILIEKVTFRKSTLLRYYQTRKDARLPLMAKLNFCGLPPFEISQDAVRSPNSLDFGKVGEFNCGESCLFFMAPSTLTRNIRRSPIEITVVRKHTSEIPPDFIGSAQVNLPESMIDTVNNAVRSQALPLTSTHEDTVNIKSDDNGDAGFLSIFARLTCFGKYIITEFKLMKETKSFLFKSATADAPYLCDSLEPGEFPIADPKKICAVEGNSVFVREESPDAGEMLAFGDFGITALRSHAQKPLYYFHSGEISFTASADIDSVLESFKTMPSLPNYFKFPILKRHHVISRKLSELVTVKSPGKAPILSTERLRGGGCKGEEPNRRSRTVSFCGAGGSSGSRTAGPCCVATSGQRLCICESCTNTKDVPPPPRFPVGGLRCIQDVVPATPIICTQDEVIDPDMEKHIEPKITEVKSREWRQICCCVWGGTPGAAVRPEGPGEEYKMPNPPIRYDTTGALTAAADGVRSVPLGHLVVNADPDAPNPLVRYDNTGALSKGPERSKDGRYVQANPPVRYDTTGVLTAAAGGRRDIPLGKLVFNRNPRELNPPIRYDTTSALTRSGAIIAGAEPKMPNPPIRYDTTGALTAAAGGRRPIPLGQLVISALPDAPNPPARYDNTGALSSAAAPYRPEADLAEEEEDEQFIALYEEKETRTEEASLEELFPQYFVPETYLVQELECAIRRTQRTRKRRKRHAKTKDRAFLPPGVLIGHRNCVEWEPRVPAKQGWLWNRLGGILGLPLQPGWKPGAVRRSVMMQIRRLEGWVKKLSWSSQLLDKPMIPPTLHIAKKKGVYYITMRPMDMAPDDPTPPITFRLPPLAEGEADVWDEDDMSSASSDLEIEFCAPGTCPPENPPKDIAIQCSLSQGLVPTTTSSTDGKSSKSKGKGKKKK